MILSAVSPPAASLRAAQRQLTRSRIRDAAASLFYAHGFSAVTMDDIAKTARISRSTLYVHYPDKTDLSADIAASYGAALCLLVNQLPGPVPSRAQIEDWIGSLAQLIERERIPATLISELSTQRDTPAAVAAIGEQLVTNLAVRLPCFAGALGRTKTAERARAWCETLMRELGWACLSVQGRTDGLSKARLAVAADLFGHFIQAQLEMVR